MTLGGPVWRKRPGKGGDGCDSLLLLLLLLFFLFPCVLFADQVVRFEETSDTEDDFLNILQEEQFMVSGPSTPPFAHRTLVSRTKNSSSNMADSRQRGQHSPTSGGNQVARASSLPEEASFPAPKSESRTRDRVGETGRGAMEEEEDSQEEFDDFLEFTEDMERVEERRREEERVLALRIKRATIEGSGTDTVDGKLTFDRPYNSALDDPQSSEYGALSSTIETQITAALQNQNESGTVSVTGYSAGSTVVEFTIIVQQEAVDRLGVSRALLAVRASGITYNGQTFALLEDPLLEKDSAAATFEAVSCVLCGQYPYKQCVQDNSDATRWICQTTSTHYFQHGSNEGDICLSESQSPYKIDIPGFLPIDGQLMPSLFMSVYGLISFNSSYSSSSPVSLPVTNQKLMCGYWADMQLLLDDARATWCHQVYKRDENSTAAELTMLTTGGERVKTYANISTYDPVFMLVVTFEDMAPDDSQADTAERVNFQMAVISDGFTTYGMFIFASGGMQWESSLGYTVTIGVFDSNFNIDTSRPDSPVGNTGQTGVWFFPLSSEVVNPARKCLNWYLSELPHVDQYVQALSTLPACPCVKNVTEFSNNLEEESSQDGVDCFLAVSSNHTKRCCYLNEAGSFLQNAPLAGSFLRHHPDVNSSGYTVLDQLPKQHCCFDSDHCDQFYHVRPISTCETINVQRSLGTGDPHITTLDGKTFSFNAVGEFTMLRFQQPSFELQARTCPAVDSGGSPVRASVFCGFAAKGQGAPFQVELSINKISLNLYLDKRDITLQFQEQTNFKTTQRGVNVRRKTDKTVLVYFQDEEIGLTVTVVNRQLTIQTDLRFKNTGPAPKGLLGNLNGNPDDDYIFPNGNTLPSDTEERDLLPYGKTWAVSGDSTLFVYPEGLGTADFTDDAFQPIFLSEMTDQERTQAETVCGGLDDLSCLYDFFATKDEALAVGTKSSKVELKDSLIIAKNRAPTVVLLGGLGRLEVTKGQQVSISFNASDEDEAGAVPSYNVLEKPAGFSLDQASQTASWTPNTDDSYSLEIVVVDSQGVSSPSLKIPIVQCSGCNDHGTCNFDQTRSSIDNYFRMASCSCEPYYTGLDCELDFDACADDPCPLQTTCTDLSAQEHEAAGQNSRGYNCSDCPAGYQALMDGNDIVDCKDINECQTGSCQQTCTNTIGSFKCSCLEGYRKDLSIHTLCIDIDECQENTHDCQQTCVNTPGSWNCSCFLGYSPNVSVPNTCVKDQVDPCAALSPPCEYACKNESGVTACLCASGYKVDPADQRSCTDINECDLNQCSQKCSNTNGSFTCSCYPGYILDADKISCNECPTYNYGENCAMTCDCRGHGRCDRVKGCVCDAGWSGNTCSVDVNECDIVPSVCPVSQLCRNTQGSFACDCPQGYRKDSTDQCVDIDECLLASDNNCQQVCTNSPGSYVCSCVQGYNYIADNNACVDIDECATSIAKCEYGCENFPGSANCLCGLGFVLNDDRRTCVEKKNPCEDLADKKDCQYACRIDNGAPQCYCQSGYELHSDGLQCVDIDECSSSDSNKCAQNCDNTVGNYQCSCSTGYKLDNDRRTCVECDSNHWGDGCNNTCDCSALGTRECHKETGCRCLEGWAGDKCQLDVDECLQDNPARCQDIANSQCANSPGSFKCLCLSGYRLTSGGDACQDINECQEPTSPCDQICTNNDGSYVCSCANGFKIQDGSCVDINECVSLPCDQICRNTVGGYSCACEDGFLLNTTTRNTCYVQNECSSNNTCEQGCVHKPGTGDECYCQAGFDVNSNNSSKCDDINECGDTPCVNGTCTNSPPGSFTCTCSAGLQLLSDKVTCQVCPEGKWGDNCASNCTCAAGKTEFCDPVTGDCTCKQGWTEGDCSVDVDECTQNATICAGVANSQCEDTDGSYRCKCNVGFFTSAGQCLPCDTDKYGTECSQACPCELANMADCDDVIGNCTCKPEWTGANCTEDVNECTPVDPCQTAKHETCRNTVGGHSCDCVAGYARPNPGQDCSDIDECESPTACNITTESCVNGVGFYTCVCALGYANSSQGCQAVFLSVEVTFQLNMTAEESLDDSTSPYYIRLSNSIKVELTRVYRAALGSAFLEIVIKRLRVGSVIADFEVRVDGNQTDNPEGLVAKGTAEVLAAGALTVDGVNVTVPSVTVANTTYNASSSVCDIYTGLGNCNASYPCVVDTATGQPKCQIPEEENMDLVIGLGVGIPLLFVATFVVAFIIYCIVKRRRHRGSIYDDADSDKTASIFAHKLPTMGHWGAPHPLYDNRSVSNGSDGSEGDVVGGRGAARGRSDFKDSAWYDRSQPFASPDTHRTVPRPGLTSDPNNSSWDYIFNALGPYRESQPYAIKRPKVEASANPLQAGQSKGDGPGSMTSA